MCRVNCSRQLPDRLRAHLLSSKFTEQAADLVCGLLRMDGKMRLTAEAALQVGLVGAVASEVAAVCHVLCLRACR